MPSIFETKMNHICAITRQTSMSFIPRISVDASWWERLKRTTKKLILVSEMNPGAASFYTSYAEILQSRKDQIKSGSNIIHPFSMFRLYYEMYFSIVLLLTLIILPIVAAFHGKHKITIGIEEQIVNELLCWLTDIDIVLKFFTGYPVNSKKIVVMQPGLIAKNYILSIHFTSDVVSSIPQVAYKFLLPYKATKFMDFLGLARITRLPTLFFYLDRTADQRNVTFIVFKYTIITYVVFHWFSCIMLVVPQFRSTLYSKFHSKSWVVEDQILYKGFSTQYIRCLYRTSACLLGIDIHAPRAVVWEEILLEIFLYIFGHIFMAFMVIIVIQMKLAKSAIERKYYETMSQVQGYMIRKDLPLQMRNRIVQYYNYKYNRKYFKEHAISAILSEKLKKEINMHVCKRLVQSVSLFADLPFKILEDILNQLEPEIFLPNDIIVTAGAYGDCMYFLANGTVAILTPSGKEVCHLQDGAYFGEISILFKNKKRTANVVAIETCEVYKLKRRAFRNSFMQDASVLKNLEAIAMLRMERTQMMEDTHKSMMESNNANPK